MSTIGAKPAGTNDFKLSISCPRRSYPLIIPTAKIRAPRLTGCRPPGNSGIDTRHGDIQVGSGLKISTVSARDLKSAPSATVSRPGNTPPFQGPQPFESTDVPDPQDAIQDVIQDLARTPDLVECRPTNGQFRRLLKTIRIFLNKIHAWITRPPYDRTLSPGTRRGTMLNGIGAPRMLRIQHIANK